MRKMPYFDYLFTAFAEGSKSLETSFGNHVHWGYWDTPTQAKSSHEDFAAAAENLTQLIYHAAEVKNAQTILDVGCGFGGTIASLNQHYQDMELVGLNIDERQLIRARQQVTSIGTNTIQFQQGDACALPFADNSFDVVLAVECIFHFPSRAQFFKEAYRVLKPGGYLALSDFLLRKKLAKLHDLKISKYLTQGFFGACNVQYHQQKYRQLAEETHLTVEFERNITKNTLPTYRYFRSLLREPKLHKTIGMMLTLVCTELLSRVHALEYFVFSFRKPL